MMRNSSRPRLTGSRWLRASFRRLAIIGALWRRNERAMLWLPAPQAARWGGLAAALAYAVFSGFGVPAQEKSEVLAAFSAHKREVTEGSMAAAG